MDINAYAQYDGIFSICKIGILKILLTGNSVYSLIINLYFTLQLFLREPVLFRIMRLKETKEKEKVWSLRQRNWEI